MILIVIARVDKVFSYEHIRLYLLGRVLDKLTFVTCLF